MFVGIGNLTTYIQFLSSVCVCMCAYVCAFGIVEKRPVSIVLGRLRLEVVVQCLLSTHCEAENFHDMWIPPDLWIYLVMSRVCLKTSVFRAVYHANAEVIRRSGAPDSFIISELVLRITQKVLGLLF